MSAFSDQTMRPAASFGECMVSETKTLCHFGTRWRRHEGRGVRGVNYSPTKCPDCDRPCGTVQRLAAQGWLETASRTGDMQEKARHIG